LRILSNEPDKRVRCIGHIFNLVVRSVMNASEHGKIEIPAICKIRRLAKQVSRSMHLKAKWRKQFKTMISLDNDTRWNSVLKMIESVIDKRLDIDKFTRDAIKEEKDRNMKEKLQSAILDNDDWDILEELQTVLAPFERFTVMLQGTITLLDQFKSRKRK
jgi:hypothetical protein